MITLALKPWTSNTKIEDDPMQLLINSTQLKKNKEATVHSMSALCKIASALPYHPRQ